jgi:hypothetical protein
MGHPPCVDKSKALLPAASWERDDQLASPATKAECPIQARFWLEWDATALRCAFFVTRRNLFDGFGLIQGWEGRPHVIYTSLTQFCVPQQYSFKGAAYQQQRGSG